MSYILDALRKSERERAVGNIPTLGTPYVPGVSATRFWLWGTLAAVLIGVAVVGGYLSWQDRATTSARAPAKAAAATPAPAAATPAASPVPQQVTAAQAQPASAAPAAPAAASVKAPPPVEEVVPGLTVNVVAYSEDPARRFVMINLKSYKEGEHTVEGAVVEQITPDGAVVNFKGRRIRLHP
jgi:general secretion pathway protein B